MIGNKRGETRVSDVMWFYADAEWTQKIWLLLTYRC